MSDLRDPDVRQNEILSAVLKFLGITAGVAVLIWIGTTIVVNALDLDEVTTGPVTNSAPFAPPSVLPTVALPTEDPDDVPTEEPSEIPTELPSDIPTPDSQSIGEDGLVLSASPLSVEAGGRIDFAGSWPGRDNLSLRVQRFESGEWVDFGVSTQVRVGSFSTYVLTSRDGPNRFRVYDPATDTSSNEVTVTVG